ncbi:TetR/AcrR family transcriptional regulator [Marinibaculum pumilum]|uniref:TetR/AcrR family transcriptional regulator n=1 Tax=Marinibaculum pumilum TaxID=1766165 RepID=A0ABV7L4F8_9PROT
MTDGKADQAPDGKDGKKEGGRAARPAARRRGRPPQPEAIEERRKQILAAAIEIFGRRGFHDATMQQISRAAGISVGLIYQYFRDKEDLLHAVISEILDSYLREIPAARATQTEPLERLHAAVRAYFRVVDEHRAAALIGYRESRVLPRARMTEIMARERETTGLIAESVEECRRAGVLQVADPELLTYQLVVYVHAWPLHAWRLEPQPGGEAYIERGMAQLLRPVQPAPEAPPVPSPARRNR